MIISIIAAMDKNRLIGQGNHLPWKLPADIKHFRKLTVGKAVVMGRRTFDSIGKSLAKRTNVILTHDQHYNADGCIIAHSINESLTKVEYHEEVMIIGGCSIYEQFLQHAEILSS